MFRPMRRIKQQLSEDEALEVLKNAKRGVLSVIGDDGWPYGIHLNPYWEDGRLYFHGAKSGHKIDALRRDARTSFTDIDDGVKDDGGWAYTFRSVIVDEEQFAYRTVGGKTADAFKAGLRFRDDRP